MKSHTTHDTVPPPRVIYSNLPKAIAQHKPTSGAGAAISKRGKKSKKKAQKSGALATLVKPAAKVRDYDAHVLVCKGGDCKKRGSKAVRKSLKDELRAEGMNRDVRVDSVGCLGLCKHGPNLVVYPGGCLVHRRRRARRARGGTETPQERRTRRTSRRRTETP